jgi:hypothetical protein
MRPERFADKQKESRNPDSGMLFALFMAREVKECCMEALTGNEIMRQKFE